MAPGLVQRASYASTARRPIGQPAPSAATNAAIRHARTPACGSSALSCGQTQSYPSAAAAATPPGIAAPCLSFSQKARASQGSRMVPGAAHAFAGGSVASSEGGGGSAVTTPGLARTPNGPGGGSSLQRAATPQGCAVAAATTANLTRTAIALQAAVAEVARSTSPLRQEPGSAAAPNEGNSPTKVGRMSREEGKHQKHPRALSGRWTQSLDGSQNAQGQLSHTDSRPASYSPVAAAPSVDCSPRLVASTIVTGVSPHAIQNSAAPDSLEWSSAAGLAAIAAAAAATDSTTAARGLAEFKAASSSLVAEPTRHTGAASNEPALPAASARALHQAAAPPISAALNLSERSISPFYRGAHDATERDASLTQDTNDSRSKGSDHTQTLRDTADMPHTDATIAVPNTDRVRVHQDDILSKIQRLRSISQEPLQHPEESEQRPKAVIFQQQLQQLRERMTACGVPTGTNVLSARGTGVARQESGVLPQSDPSPHTASPQSTGVVTAAVAAAVAAANATAPNTAQNSEVSATAASLPLKGGDDRGGAVQKAAAVQICPSPTLPNRALIAARGTSPSRVAVPPGPPLKHMAIPTLTSQGREDAAGCVKEPAVAGKVLAVAEGLQRQLDNVLNALRTEQMEREQLSVTVNSVEQQLKDGLVSLGDVVNARRITDGATDTVLNAMRKCVDELSVHCAWPPPNGGRSGEELLGDGPAQTLSEAVQRQAEQLRQLMQAHEQLQLQHEEQRAQVSATSVWLTQQQKQMSEGFVSIAATANSWPAQHEALTASIEALQHQVGELSNSVSDLPPVGELIGAIQSQETQIQALQADKAQMTDVFQSFQEMHEQLCGRQREQDEHLNALVSAFQEVTARVKSTSGETTAKETLAETGSIPGEALQEIRQEVAVLTTTVAHLCEKVDELSVQDAHNSLQTEIGAIASVVSSLSDRMDRFSSLAEAATSPATGAVATSEETSTEETAQALRMQLGRLLGDVQRAGESRAFGAPQSVLQKAPSPRRWMMEPLSVSVGRQQNQQFATAAPQTPGILATGGGQP